MPPFPVAALPP
jgi:hypothetical protein